MKRRRMVLFVLVLLLITSAAIYATDDPPCDCQIGSDDTSTTTCGAGTACQVNESWFRCGDSFWYWSSDNTCNGLRRLKANQ